jgi:hypothetical protein
MDAALSVLEAQIKVAIGITNELEDGFISPEEARDIKPYWTTAFCLWAAGEDGEISREDFYRICSDISTYADVLGITVENAAKMYIRAGGFKIENVSALRTEKGELLKEFNRMMEDVAADGNYELSDVECFMKILANSDYFGANTDVIRQMEAFIEDYRKNNSKDDPSFDKLFEHLFKCFEASRFNFGIQEKYFGMKGRLFLRASTGAADDVTYWLKGKYFASSGGGKEYSAKEGFKYLNELWDEDSRFDKLQDALRSKNFDADVVQQYIQALVALNGKHPGSELIQGKIYTLLYTQLIGGVLPEMHRMDTVVSASPPERRAEGALSSMGNFFGSGTDFTKLEKFTSWMEYYVDFASNSPVGPGEGQANVLAYNYYNGLAIAIIKKLNSGEISDADRVHYVKKLNEILEKQEKVLNELKKIGSSQVVLAQRELALRYLDLADGASAKDAEKHIARAFEIAGLLEGTESELGDYDKTFIYMKAVKILWNKGNDDLAKALLLNGLDLSRDEFNDAELPITTIKLEINGTTVEVKIKKGEKVAIAGVEIAGRKVSPLPYLGGMVMPDTQKAILRQILNTIKGEAAAKKKRDKYEMKRRGIRAEDKKEALRNLSKHSGVVVDRDMEEIIRLLDFTFVPDGDSEGSSSDDGGRRGGRNGGRPGGRRTG